MKWLERFPGSPLRRGPRGILIGIISILDGLAAVASFGLWWPHLWFIFFSWEASRKRKE